jgi:hypothetical protein
VKLSKEQYERYALELENDQYFYKRYIRLPTCGERRSLIRRQITSELGYYGTDIEDGEQLRRYFDDKWSITSDPEGQRKYDTLIDIWVAPQPTLNPRYLPLVDKIMKLGIGAKWEKAADQKGYASSLAAHFGYYCSGPDLVLLVNEVNNRRNQKRAAQPQKEEPTMNSPTPIEITTKTFVNGNDVSTMTDGQIYALIAGEEQRIRELRAIGNQPKRLVAEIAKREAGIQALVTYLDSKE